MNLHQKLKSIETNRHREECNPGLKVASKWESPIEGKHTKRRKLSLKPEPKTEPEQAFGRGPLEIGLIDQKGGHSSIVHRSISLQMKQFENIIDSRINEIKNEILSK